MNYLVHSLCVCLVYVAIFALLDQETLAKSKAVNPEVCVALNVG